MLHSLRIVGFRRFQQFEIPDLARINLLVGGNNVGKSTILEAIELLLDDKMLRALYRIPARRREHRRIPAIEELVSGDLAPLFTGHAVSEGTSCAITADLTDDGRRSFTARVERSDNADGSLVLHLTSEREQPSGRVISPRPPGPGITQARQGPVSLKVSITTDGAVLFRRATVEDASGRVPAFMQAGAGDPTAWLAVWDEIVLTPDEERAIEMMRIIEPSIERVAAGKETFYVKRAGGDQRVPLGSLGEGIARLFLLALHLARASGGCLLVDDIDAGLHYSVLDKLWRCLLRLARAMDAQIVATTHSLDCLRALARVCAEDASAMDEIRLHRIEADARWSVTYTSSEIATIDETRLEVR